MLGEAVLRNLKFDFAQHPVHIHIVAMKQGGDFDLITCVVAPLALQNPMKQRRQTARPRSIARCSVRLVVDARFVAATAAFVRA